MEKRRMACTIAFLAFATCLVNSQQYFPNREVRVSNLPALTAESKNAGAVLAAALETIVGDTALCCRKDSALENEVLSADPKTLKDVSARLQGRHLLSDGRPIMVTAEYLPADTLTPARIMTPLMNHHAMLMEWKSHLYILYGVIFDETIGGTEYSIPRGVVVHKLLLIDPRYADSRRETSFDRATDDWSQVQGLLRIEISPH